jgi:asparagine synthase (glutamine-hydrolysing)
MCGLVAMLSPERPISHEVIRRATHSLEHRGPDAQRYWLSDNRRMALGHARLSIIDLQTGEQPIATDDGQMRAAGVSHPYRFSTVRK